MLPLTFFYVINQYNPKHLTEGASQHSQFQAQECPAGGAEGRPGPHWHCRFPRQQLESQEHDVEKVQYIFILLVGIDNIRIVHMQIHNLMTK